MAPKRSRSLPGGGAQRGVALKLLQVARKVIAQGSPVSVGDPPLGLGAVQHNGFRDERTGFGELGGIRFGPRRDSRSRRGGDRQA